MLVIYAYKGREIATFDIFRIVFVCEYAKGLKYFIKIKRNIIGYSVSDQSIAQQEREVQKQAEGIIYVGITYHIWVHIIGSTLVKIILKNINGERFQT